MMESKIEVVLSLGGLCQVAVQLETYFGYRVSSPFDWLVTPFDSLAKIFNDNGSNFSESISVISNGSTVICNRYGVAYQHDYPRSANRLVQISLESIQSSTNKMKHKYTKFSNLLDKNHKILFVRLGGHHDCALPDPYIVDPRIITNQDLNDLCKCIDEVFPNINFEMAFVYFKQITKTDIDRASLDRRVRLFEIEWDGDRSWIGSSEDWKKVFDTYEYDIKGNFEKASQFKGVHVDGWEHLHA